MAAARRGVDVVAEEEREREEAAKAAESAITVEQVTRKYLDHARKHIRRARWVERMLERHVLPKLGDKPLASVKRRDVLALLDDMAERGLRQMQNRVRATLSSLFRYAVEYGYCEHNIISDTRPRPVEIQRDRALSDAEVQALWRALDEMPEPGRCVIKMLLLTGARRDEVRRMAWSEINGDVWTLPAARSKSKRPLEVPLSRQALELIAQMPRLGHCVFTVADDGSRPWTAIDLFKAKLDKMAGIAPWRIHDLRRTCRSGLAALGVPAEIAERCLGHSPGRLVRTYDVHRYIEEKRRALQAWGDYLDRLTGEGLAAVNVLEFRPPGA
jgi:integrase